MTMTATEVRVRAAQLVRNHAARLGMDSFAAEVLERAILQIPCEGEHSPSVLASELNKDIAGRAGEQS